MQYVIKLEEGEVYLKGCQGLSQRVRRARLGIPTVTSTGEPILFEVPGPGVLREGAHGLLVAHGLMQRAGYKIDMQPGTSTNPSD